MLIVIELDAHQPPAGRLLTEAGAPHEFTGWLALLRLLDDVVACGRQEEEPAT